MGEQAPFGERCATSKYSGGDCTSLREGCSLHLGSGVAAYCSTNFVVALPMVTMLPDKAVLPKIYIFKQG